METHANGVFRSTTRELMPLRCSKRSTRLRSTKRQRLLRFEPLEVRSLLSAVPHLTAGWTAHPTDRSFLATPAGSTSPTGTTPNQMRGAYGLGTWSSGSISGGIMFGSVQGDGSGQTIAIVDAYDDPNAMSDLNAFSNHWGLPQFASPSNPVAGEPTFQKLNETGGTSLPGKDPNGAGSSSWEVEESLDIEWAHVIAPKANIILFEASTSGTDLFTAVHTAAGTAGVVAVSMSWSASETGNFSDYSQEAAYDSQYFTTPSGHPGVTFFAASGDSGAYDPTNSSTISPQYPADSPNVVGVGGTTLSISGTSWSAETAWGNGTSSGSLGGGGGGISAYEPVPSFQSGLPFDSTYGLSTRVYPDIAADADPNTGVSVYDTYDFGSSAPWAQYGGTSLATPMWAAMLTIADQGRSLVGLSSLDGPSQTLPMLYKMSAGNLHDIASGSIGPSPEYSAATGYDLTSGRGTPQANLVIPAFVGSPPTVANPASATPNPVTTGTTTALSVLGADSGGESSLTYTWTATTLPTGAAQPIFSVNGTNAAKNTTATFNAAGAYVLQATITGSDGASVTSSVAVTVDQVYSGISVSPSTVGLSAGQTQQFTAAAVDQFGGAMPSQPSFTWSATSGTITSTGFYTSAGTAATITATNDSFSGTAQVFLYQPPTVVTPAAAAPSPVTGTTTLLSVLGDDAGGESTLTYTWTATTVPSGAAQPTYSVNGTNAAKNSTATFSAAGTYVFQVTILDASNWTVTSSVSVTVVSTLSSLSISSGATTVSVRSQDQFTAVGVDQFGNTVSNPSTVSWSAANGAITSTGLYTPPATGTTDTITATSGGLQGTTAVTIAAPVGWWKLNEGSGATAHDSGAGTSDNATVSSGNWISAPNGADGMAAMSFDGASDSLINVGNPAKLNFTGQITLSAWVKLSYVDSSTVEYIIDHRNDITDDMYLGIDNGQYEVGVQLGYLPADFYGADFTVPSSDVGAWVHIAGTYDGAAWRLYRDGQLVATSIESQGAIAPRGNWGIGGAATGSGYLDPALYFTGGIDDPRIYKTAISGSAISGLMGTPPLISSAAAAASNPVAGTSTALSVTATDDAGPAALTYTWAAIGTPPAPVSFSVNGTNAAKNTVAHFTAAGVYHFVVTVTNPAGMTAASSVAVTVNATPTTLAVAGATPAPDGTTAFTATIKDQFGNALVSQPAFTWALSGGGAITSGGLFTPAYAVGTETVTASADGISGSATVSLPGAANWTSTDGTSWNSAGAWTIGSPAAAVAAPGTRTVSGDYAVFVNGTGGTVNLDGASPALAGLTFGDAGSYIIAPGSGGTLQLANGAGSAALTVSAGAQTIGAPLAFNSNVTISVAPGSTLTITGDVTGNGHSLTVSGGGKVYLNGLGTNTIGSTIVASGRLVVQGSAAVTDGSSLVVGDASAFAAAAPAVTSTPALGPSKPAAHARGSVVSFHLATLSVVPPLGGAAPTPAPQATSARPPGFPASFDAPALSIRLRPALRAAAAVLAQQNPAASNRDAHTAMRALDAVFASYGRRG